MEILSPEWRCFLEAGRRGSFSEAAVALRLTQPSITKYIDKLERTLGTLLFQRTNRGVRLTETGQLLLMRIENTCYDLEKTVRGAILLEEKISGLVKFGSHRVIAREHATKPLAKLYEDHRELKFEFHLAPSIEITRQVASGELDYGLVTNPQTLPGLVVKKCSEEYVGVFSLKMQATSDLGRILYNPEMRFLSKALKQLRGVPLETVPDYEVISVLAASNPLLGALVPNTVAKRFGLGFLISPIFFKASICLVYRADTRKTQRHLAIVESFIKRR